MADVEFWIQIENKNWDLAPKNVDRMTGRTIQQLSGRAPVLKPLASPETGTVTNRLMYLPLDGDPVGDPSGDAPALILRRYTTNWAAPDDRKVNPWDLNEPDPTDNGTMGTIPGPVIECQVGDRAIVHFRNKDFRASKQLLARTHSLHPHGFVFDPRYDGAYPLSPPDPSQPVGAEAALWSALGVNDFKKADRIPPGGTFTYTWNTFGWPTTAGVWLYHDHSVCDDANIQLGAIGIIVIHNPADPEDVLTPDLPGGSPIGSPVTLLCFPPPFPIPLFFHDLDTNLAGLPAPAGLDGMPAMGTTMPIPDDRAKKPMKRAGSLPMPEMSGPFVQRDLVTLQVDVSKLRIARFCLPIYRPPPQRALYLQLYHEISGTAQGMPVGMLINGRKYLGNTPTLVAGLNTKMRFGLVGMNMGSFHTFHLHGHRWVIPGPQGNTQGAIQGSPMIQAVSQFEDTKIFGPANSFVFTINQGSFMGSLFTPDPSQASAVGEWHMHCHVLMHMMDGMMGSLLVIRGGELALGLPSGQPCPTGTAAGIVPVSIVDFAFSPQNVMINIGQTVRWTNTGSPHTVTSNPGTLGCMPTSTEAFNSGVMPGGGTFDHTFNAPGTYTYHCEIHGCMMSGTVTVM